MKNFFKQLLSDNSTVSMMRFMALSSLIIGATIAFQDKTAVAMVSIFVGAAFAGKVTQKIV